MQLPAFAYSAVTNAASRLLRLEPMEIPSSSTTTTDNDTTTTSRRRQVAVVTGSNTGVGYETAKALVQDHGFDVIIACRSRRKGLQACRDININNNSKRGTAVFVEPLDLADLQSVRDFGRAVDQQYDTIDVLINNAGRNSAGPAAAAAADNPTDDDSSSSSQQLDLLFQTNFLGHFLLTHQLLEKSKCRRVVNLSSVMHHFPKYSNNDDNNNEGDGGGISSKDFWRTNAVEPAVVTTAAEEAGSVVRKTYAPSKLAAVLFSLELNRRYGESKGLRSIAVNPGSV
jgi:NAD(P)-dependent dehydrogenase (short-subunit alcohol dehydrogenase family)